MKYVKQPHSSATSASYLYGNPKLYLFLKDVIGAINGSHIHLSAPSSLHTACQNWKGQLSQNCLFCCSFDMIFTYVMTGWEGSAFDTCVFESALYSDLKIPEGIYQLADAGFPHCKQLLVPYQGKNYHLAEWGRVKLQYSVNELYYKMILSAFE
jgi:DDE superfamily endonuclease